MEGRPESEKTGEQGNWLCSALVATWLIFFLVSFVFGKAAAADVHLYKYVEVFGHFRMMDSTLCLMAFRIRPLTNYNLVMYFLS